MAIKRIIPDVTASAGVEMALVVPIFLVLILGSVDLGNYFLRQHVFAKAVRDGARYAARLPIANYSCPSGQAVGSLVSGLSDIKNVVIRGSVAATGEPLRLPSNTSVTVQVACRSASTYTGIYRGLPGDVPVVTVSATVAYSSIVRALGLSGLSLSLNSASQAAVMGI